MKRIDVTEMIIEAKLKKGLKWSDIAKTMGHSKEWTTAAMLGQMTLSRDEAMKTGALLDLPEAAVALLQVVPYKGALPSAVPTDFSDLPCPGTRAFVESLISASTPSSP